jgi:hypothetical protein
MNFIKCGELYKLDYENVIQNNNKNVQLFRETKNIVDIIIEYVYEIFEFDPNSVYLRGSCLYRKISDPTVCDIDLLFVFEDGDYEEIYKKESEIGFYKFRYFKKQNELIVCKHKKNIENKISSLLGFLIQTDLKFMSKKMFIDDQYTRFFSKKIYGYGKDLSLSKLHLSSLNQIFFEIINVKIHTLNKHLFFIKNCLLCKNVSENDKNNMVKIVIKLFYRYFSWNLFLQKNVYSRDLYYCHQIMIEKYSNFSNDLENISDLFLNVSEYDTNQIINVIDKIIYFIRQNDISLDTR